jgi:hypothetical protein
MPDETLLQQLIFPGAWLLGLLRGLVANARPHAATRQLLAYVASMLLLIMLLILAGICQQGDWVAWFGLALIVLPVAMLLLTIGHQMGCWLKRKAKHP